VNTEPDELAPARKRDREKREGRERGEYESNVARDSSNVTTSTYECTFRIQYGYHHGICW
jgi:hypothetical protein